MRYNYIWLGLLQERGDLFSTRSEPHKMEPGISNSYHMEPDTETTYEPLDQTKYEGKPSIFSVK